MHVLRILLLVMTAGVLAFILYQAITRQNQETLSGL
jgi:Tfp pilus assembly protein PilV